MRCTVIGHSSLFFETSGPTILVDPWFAGSCYWRSWWHYPPMGDVDPAWLKPDYLYVSHDHFDHFHYPTVRRIDRSTHVLVPRFGIDFMVGEFRRLGFEKITEIPHGRLMTLAPGVRVGSYQYGFDDTLFAVADGDTTVYDLNDCKIRGPSLRKVVKQIGQPDLMLKSHSFAQGYPNCYDADDPNDVRLLSRDTYMADFVEVVDEVKPRFAVPFASMVGFLHPETRQYNEFLVTPPEVVDAYRAASPDSPTEVVTMAPGDTWDSASGFTCSDDDWYTDREQLLEECAQLAAPSITRTTYEESQRTVSWDTFQEFFTRFVRAVPRVAARLALKRPIVFKVNDEPEPYWILDFRRRRVIRAAAPPDDAASIIETPPGVLADAIDNLIVHYIHISMRFRTRLLKGGVGTDFAFWTILLMWELGYLPMRRLFRPRMIGTMWRRRTEFLHTLKVALRGRGSMVDRMAGQIATRETSGAR